MQETDTISDVSGKKGSGLVYDFSFSEAIR